MPVNNQGFMLLDLDEKYKKISSSPTFERLYEGIGWGHMFSVLHEALNEHFEAINGRAETSKHYWAANSREFLKLVKEMRDDLHALKLAGVDVALDSRYEDAIERCKPWMSQSGGSTVPDDFELIDIIKYEQVITEGSVVRLKKQSVQADLKMIGNGSYANVYSYVDPDYGIKFAVKRAKRDVGQRDLERFRNEFDVMKNLSFPYIVEVYKFDDQRNEYKMEFCDDTLRKYISKNNGNLSMSIRKRIALQFLYGINYIHSNKLLHRDISLQNVLLKVYASGAVIVKLSDFGLVKNQESTFTRTQTEMRGTIRDPQLASFKDYGVPNEIYAIGWILAYIFTGRETLSVTLDEIGDIIRKCTDPNLGNRYSTVLEVIDDIERVDAAPETTSASRAEA